MGNSLRSATPQVAERLVDESLDDTVLNDEIDHLVDQDHDEINDLLQEAYDARERRDSAPLEPLHILLAEARARFDASRG